MQEDKANFGHCLTTGTAPDRAGAPMGPAYYTAQSLKGLECRTAPGRTVQELVEGG